MLINILKMAVVSIVPVIVSAAMYLLDKRTGFGRLRYNVKQVVFGLVFGGLSVLGTEFGINIGGAVINVRDAAPLCAGLIFGAPAGLLAGVIGGMERWLAVYWGAGAYTRLACTLGTILAGAIGALLRRYLFDDKKPAWYYGLSTGCVAEILHMLLVFLTNMNDTHNAFAVVRRCAPSMIFCNGVSVMLATLVVSLLGRERLPKRGEKPISQTVQRWLLICVIVAFCVTSIFTFVLQTSLSKTDAETLLRINIGDVRQDIEDASDENLLALTHRITDALDGVNATNELLVAMKAEYDVSEINLVDSAGVIRVSSEPDYVGFDMSVGEQSGEFMVLLGEQSEYVQEYRAISRDSSRQMKYAGASLGDGFVQVGYDAERFRKDVDSQVVGVTRNRRVGEGGCIIIAGEDWNIVSDRNDNEGLNLDVTGIWIDRDVLPEAAVFESEVYGEACYCMYVTTEGYYIVAVMPVSEAVFFRDVSVHITIFMEILVFAAMFILIYFLIKKLVVENIHKINGTLAEITGGNLNVSVDVRSNEEFASLSDDINTTVVTLKKYITEAAARIDKELEFAKTIQASTLPSVFPPYPERTDFDIYARMDTAKEVGGDFYDFYLLDDDRLAFLMADVSGKGISAAMFMMTAKTLIKTIAEKESDVASILTLANAELCRGNEAEMFVTCWMGILDFRTHTVTFANAGHNPPLVRHGDGSFEYFKSRPGFVLAGMEGVRYRKGEFELRPGDEIFLYTDGVTEATDAHETLYGDDRLHAVLNTLCESSARDVCCAVKDDVDAFVGEAPQFDDMTMLCLRLLPQHRLTLTPAMDTMQQAADFVESTLEEAGVPRKIILKMNIAVDEIYSNIVRYSGADAASIECAVANGRVELTFSDNGKPYDPLDAGDPDITASADDRAIGGLGVFMVKKSMDEIRYEYRDGRNILRLRKAL